MSGSSGSGPYVRFSLMCAMVVFGVAGAFAFLIVHLVSGWGQANTAAAVAQTVGVPITAVLESGRGGALNSGQRAQLDAITEPMLSGGALAVRVRTLDGAVLYDAGDSGVKVPPATVDRVSGRRLHDGQAGLFVTSIRDGAYVVEIVQDSAALDATIRQDQIQVAATVLLFSAAAWVLAQLAFWIGIRSYRQGHNRLRYLYDTGQQLRASLDLHDVLGHVITDATKHAGGRYGLVAIYESTTSELTLKTTYDRLDGAITLQQRALDEWFVHRAIATNQTVVSTQSGSAYKMFFGPDADIDAQSAMLCVPMAIHDRVLGALAVIRAAGSSGFSGAEVRIVEDLAGQAATAIEQAQLFEKVRSDATELESSYDTTLKVLMAALDAKDNDTEGHCERVAKLTVHLAKFMKVPESMLVDIERGALLHDVGKIGVPDAVLKQPNRLNDMEWEAMRKHPLLAGLMVSKVGFLENALPILLYHHERADGGGYPFGLGGDNIPLEARIFSIVDAYDAMTSDRPYRGAMPHEQAMAEARANSGTQFDPQVVDAFEKLMASRPDLHDNSGHTMGAGHDEDLDPSLGQQVA